MMFAPKLTRERALEIQEEYMADDLPVDWNRMQSWTEPQCIAYYESGGEVSPGKVSAGSLDVLAVRDGSASHDGRLASWLREHLPPLGTMEPTMPGENSGPRVVSSGCFLAKPDARVRLFVLYGVADVTMSVAKWVEKAPDWLEVRLVELPGHGFRTKEPLPPCAADGQPGLDEAAIATQRQDLISQLSNEIGEAAGDAPFALYGFSFGALLAYGICLRLTSEGKVPLVLAAAARGSPNCATLSRATCELLCRADSEAMLAWQGGGGSFSTSNIPTHMRPRAAQLFRYGLLLGAAPSGNGVLSTTLPGGAAAKDQGEMLNEVEFRDGPPRVGAGCTVVAVGSDVDRIWPDRLVQRWADVAASAEPIGGRPSFVGKTLHDVEHMKVMVHPTTMELVAAEVGARAMEKAAEVAGQR